MTTKAQFPDESRDGSFVRQPDRFRDWVTADGRSGFPVEPGRYHLYVSSACPWASRTIIVRKLKGLDDAIGMTVVDPLRDERGWAFRDVPGASRDPINGFEYLSEAYHATDPNYRGRFTVPVLWDKQTNRIVSNSDDDIMRMFETEFEALAGNHTDLYPKEHRAEIDRLNEWIYETVNDGVYRAGFATRQAAYELAVQRLFESLDELEERLSQRRYLIAETPLEVDWRLFVTLVCFDPVYHGHFKCTVRKIAEYPNLFGYLRDLYQYDDIASIVNFDHMKRHYYMTHHEINPSGVVPIGPAQDLTAAHGRDRLP
jgi:glutathionyl-hydroquinone reductase